MLTSARLRAAAGLGALACALAGASPAAARSSCATQVNAAAGGLALARLTAAVKSCTQSPSGICFLVHSRAVRARSLKGCKGALLQTLFGNRCVAREPGCAPGTVAGPDDVARCLACSVPPEVDCATAALFASVNLPLSCGAVTAAPAATAVPQVAAKTKKKKKKKKGPNAQKCLDTLARELGRTAQQDLRAALRGQTPGGALRSSKLGPPCGKRIPDTLGYQGCPGALGCAPDADASRAGFERCANCLLGAAAVAVAARTRPGLCGNGKLDPPGERCESDDVCTLPLHCGPPSPHITQCTCFDPCGDGIVEPYEQCDPAATVTGCDAQSSCLASGAHACTCVTYPRFALVANAGAGDDTVSLFRVDVSNGTLVPSGWARGGGMPQAVALDPLARFAYVADKTDNAVTMLTFDRVTGALGALGSIPAGLGPTDVAVDPSGRFVYVPNSNPLASTISAYAIDARTGVLAEIAGSPFPAGMGPTALAIHPSGTFLFALAEGGTALERLGIDPTSGTLGAPLVVFNPTGAAGLVLDSTGRVLLVADQAANLVRAYVVDAGGGIAAAAPVAAGTGPVAAAVAPGSRFAYVASATSGDVFAFRLDPSIGALVPLGSVPAGANPSAVAVDPSGAFVYVSLRDAAEVASFAVDAASGGLVRTGTSRARLGPGPMVFTKGGTPVTRVPAFTYVANQGSNDVSVFHVDSTTGALAASGKSNAGAAPSAVAAHPSGRFVYVTNQTGGTISTYTVTNGTGALTAGAAAPTDPTPVSIAVDPGGFYAYVATRGPGNNLRSYLIDGASGALAPLQTQTNVVPPAAVLVDPTGRFLYVADDTINMVTAYVIIPGSGLLSLRGTVATGMSPGALAAHPSGRFLYVANATSNDVRAYDIVGVGAGSGLITPIGGSVAAGTRPRTLAVDPSGRFLYAGNPGSLDNSDPGSNDVSIFTIGADGGLAPLDTLPVGEKPTALVVDPSGRFVYVASATFDDALAYTIAPNGTLTGGKSVPAGADPVAIAVVGTIN